MTAAAPASSFRRMLKGQVARPLFSADWHGIQLLDVAREAGLDPAEVASEHFYAALYRRWKTLGYSSNDEWVRAKAHIAQITAGRW